MTIQLEGARLLRKLFCVLGMWMICLCASEQMVLAQTSDTQSSSGLQSDDSNAGSLDASANNELVDVLAADLVNKDKSKRLEAITTIARSAAPARQQWLEAILAGKLFQRKSDKRMVIATGSGKELALVYASDGGDAGNERKRKLKKVTLNNAMRSSLKRTIATLALTDADPLKRRAAVQGLFGTQETDVIEKLRALQGDEPDQQTKTAMQQAIAVADLTAEDPERREAALELAEGQLHPAFLNALNDVGQTTQDPELKSTVNGLLAKAKSKKRFYGWIETLFFGISLGSILTLAAIGLAITFGVMGVINMAHGELIMLGAYTTWFVQQLFPQWINYSLLIAVPAAFMVSGLVGILIERTVIRHLYGRPLETLLATFGISLLLQQLVRTTISSQNVAVINPSWMSGSVAINPVLSLTLNRIVIVGFCLAAFALLYLFMNRSGFGLQIRAVSQNRKMARALGIRSARIDALTFGLGSGIAGIAGVALSQIGNVGPNLGQNYIIDSFLVVVFGGVGNLWGTLVAGMTLGIANKLVEPFAGAVMAKILLLVCIILFIQKRPRGLFPQRGRAAEA